MRHGTEQFDGKRSPSSPARHGVRAAHTPSGSPKRAPTSSRSTCATRSTPSPIRWRTRGSRRDRQPGREDRPPHRGRTGRRPRPRAAQGRRGQGRGRVRPPRLRPRQRRASCRRRGAAAADIAAFVDAVNVMLNGVYFTIEAALPAMLRPRRRRSHRHHEFGSGVQTRQRRVRHHEPRRSRLHRRQARRHRCDAALRKIVGREEHSGQFGASGRRGDADDLSTRRWPVGRRNIRRSARRSSHCSPSRRWSRRPSATRWSICAVRPAAM